MLKNGVLAAFCLCVSVGARAENLLLNGSLEADQVDVPTFWRSSGPDGELKVLTCRSSGGPGGIPCVRFFNRLGGKAQSFSLRQYDITLAKGGRYRISAWVRTKCFTAKRFGILAVNAKWRGSVGIGSVPKDMEWRRLEAEVEMPDSLDGRYSLAIFMDRFTGEVEVADVSLEALSDDAKAGSKPSAASTAAFRPRLYPWKPLLAQIPADTRAVEFRFSGELPEGVAATDCKVSVKVDGLAAAMTCPLSEFVKISIPNDAPLSGNMHVSLVGKDDVSLLCGTYRYGIKPVKRLSTIGHRKLNNFVTEVLNAHIDSDSATFRFSTVRDGWAYLKIDGGGKASMSLDGKKVIDPLWDAAETFRNIESGEHEIVVVNAKGGRVVARSVIETLNYPPCCDSPVKENPSYGWEFFKKYVMPNATTQDGGNIPAEHRDEFFAHGGEWMSNFAGAKHIRTSEDLPRSILNSPLFTENFYCGTTVDEFFLGSPDSLERYGGGLRLLSAADVGVKRVYTWLIGKPGTDGLSREFFSTMFNASQGRGKALIEVYCRTKVTEQIARKYLTGYFADTLEKCRKCYPDAAAHVGLIVGNFNQLPVICAVHHPEVDYKYYLDMQLNYMANDPAFEGLGCTGYWGSYYADHEMHRWSMALLRHYCIEGRTDMLSERYGFSYIPGHLKNGDFRRSFDSWAVNGCVSLDEHPGIGASSQRRWGDTEGIGDTFASFRKIDGVTNSISQRVTGLVPGRMYCLQAAVFDVNDMKAGRVAPRKFALAVEVSGEVKMEPSLSWVHVDRRTKLTSKNGGARINLHHVVFTALAEEAVVTIFDVGASSGEALGVNAVSLNPYYRE